MNNSSKIIDINEIDKRKQQIYNIMNQDIQSRNNENILKKRAAIEMKYLKPELIKLHKKKEKRNNERLIYSNLIREEFDEFMFQYENGKKPKK
jgi:hypothetical protein